MISVKGPRESRSSPTNLCDTPNKGHRETLRYDQVTAFFNFFSWKEHCELIIFYFESLS